MINNVVANDKQCGCQALAIMFFFLNKIIGMNLMNLCVPLIVYILLL